MEQKLKFGFDLGVDVHDLGLLQWNLDLRKPDLRKNFDLRKIVATIDFLVHKLFDFLIPNVRFKKDFSPKSEKNRDFLAI